jgi:hypothetical protein
VSGPVKLTGAGAAGDWGSVTQPARLKTSSIFPIQRKMIILIAPRMANAGLPGIHLFLW